MNRVKLSFCFFITWMIIGTLKLEAQPFNQLALSGIAVPGIVSPKINNDYHPGWGVHYNACEMPSNVFSGSTINSITFHLNTPVPVSAPFQVRLKLRNTGDTNPLCQIQYPKSWEEVSNSGVNPIWCDGSFDPTQSTLKLTLPQGVFIYQGGGLEILRDSATADHFFSMKGYYDQQNMALWDANNMKYLLNYKPIIKVNAVPPTSAPAPSVVSIQNCSGASSFTVRQNVCFYLDNWRLTQSQVLSSNNQYQWRIYAASNLVTSLFDVTTSNSYLELTPTILSGLPVTVTDFVLKCSAQINTNVAIASYSFQISNEVSTSPIAATGESGSVISRMKIGKKTPEMSTYENMMESESYPTNFLLSRSQLSLPFENIELDNLTTGASPILYANALQSSIPEFEPGDMMRLELTMNKAMKPMLNHRAYINFDWDADQRFDSLLIFTLANTNGTYQLPSGASGSSIVNLIGGTSNEIVYSTDVFIPCDRVKDIPVKFRSGLQRLPTGWDDGEEYTIKTLCPVPQINSTAINPLCYGQTALLTASTTGCVGDFTWYKMPDLTNSIGTGTTYIATESGDYVVKFTIPGECSKYSAEYPVIISVPIAAPGTIGNSRCGIGTVNLSASVSSGTVADWYNNLSGGASINTGTSFTTPILSNNTTYYVEARNTTTGCLSSTRTAVTATINPLPAAPSVTNGSRCGNGTVNLSALVSSGTVADWYNNSSGGASINTGTSFTTPILSSNTTYYVEARNTATGCLSSTRTAVTATINPVPAAPTVINGSRCGAGTVSLSAAVGSGLVADWYSSSSGGVSLSSGNSFTTPSISSTTLYYVESRNSISGCVSVSRTAVTATVNTPVAYYSDADGDGFGAGAASDLCANPGAGFATNNTDCNDGNPLLNNISSETCNGFDDDCDGTADDGLTFVNYYNDADGDGYGAGAASNLCANPGAGFATNNTDCNDGNPLLNNISPETCNGFDDDCDGTADDGLTFVNYYNDADGDGFGAGTASNLCANPGAGFASNNTDCNDGNPLLNSIFPETCNGFDDDCDGTADDGLTFVNYYNDADGDGYGAGAASNLCANPGVGYATNNTDCNDGNASLNSISVETCNGFDDDCDGTADDGLTFVNYYNDADGDGYGAGAASNLCVNPGAGFATNNTDCNDGNASLNSISVETCNGFDDDCDGTADDGLTFVNYYNDADGDGYGAGTATNACQSPGATYVTSNTDCDDGASTISPGATEACNTFDDDCDALVDEGCSIGAALLSATSITSLPQFGLTGGNYSQNVNMALEADTPENGGNYPEKWFKFVAQSNAVRIALTGASTADDNAIAIYDDPGLSYSSPLIPIALEDDVNLSSTGVTDQGNEILLTDQLVEGNTYYVAIAHVGGTAGNVNVKFNTLLPSSCDIVTYTGGTNTFSNVCSNFKCRYRQNAKRAVVHRWSGISISGSPLQSYTIPPTTIMYTVCQLSRFVPANISVSPQTIYVSADVQYELLDAAGNMNFLTAVSTVSCSFTLNPEASINLRSTDACPNFKTTTTSIATDRSVCGTSQYQWEFTQAFPVVGLPLNVNGSVGGSRILGVNSIPGIANGQRYDVRIRALHNDAVTYSGWSAVPSCFKTLGAAGMVPWSNNDVQKLTDEMTIVYVYPNPLLQGGHAQLRSSQDIHAVQIFDAKGQLLARTESMDQLRWFELPSPEVAGLYWVVVRTGMETHRLAWLVQ